jgi:hypothetical protein
MEIISKINSRKIILIRVGHKYKNKINFSQILNFRISMATINTKVKSLKDIITKMVKIKYIKANNNKIKMLTIHTQ